MIGRNILGLIVITIFIFFRYNNVLAKTVEVYPGENSRFIREDAITKFSQIEWTEIMPGDIIILHGSRTEPYREVFVIMAQGKIQNNIIIKSAKGENPTIEAPVFFVNAAHVIFDGITIKNSPKSGINIKDGSHDITVSNCIVYDNDLGICIEASGGMNNRLINNEIYGNKLHGIGVDVANCMPGKETIIARNKVYSNGYHGIEINGCYYIIEENEVYNNGLAREGTSGIHTYARDAEQVAGDYNIIRYNISYSNNDKTSQDGNGIQLDQWCDHNQVYYNLCYDNDGPGITVFDSSDSIIYNNTLFNNMRDSGNTHAYKGELVIASDFVHNVNHARNVKVVNNIIVANSVSSYAIYVDELSSGNPLFIGNNMFFNRKGGYFYRWGKISGKDVDAWNLLKSGFKDDMYADPLFVGDTPCKVFDFALRESSPSIGKAIFMEQSRDILGGRISKDKVPCLGALEYKGILHKENVKVP